MSNPCTFGTITEKYSYALDGEYSSGSRESDVKVTKWWGKSDPIYYNTPKEVVNKTNKYYNFIC